MKTFKHILGTIVIAGMALSSCVGDLNVTPIDPNANTADKAFKDAQSMYEYLAGIYTGFATSGYYGPSGDPSISGLDGGASQYIRGLYHLSELTTDESVCGWNDQTIKNLHWMNWTTTDVFIYAIYCRIFYQISACNEFIRQVNNASFDIPDAAKYIAEARTLRALCYLHAIDNFGNVPFADETSAVGVFPEQIQRADLYAWLETELNDIINNSALAAPRQNEYGRVDKGAAKMILAKLYLNAEVYTGTPQWNKCADVLKSIMSDGYSLHENYQELFLADNNNCTDEIIFAIQQDGINTQSYGVTNYIIFASTGGEMDPSVLGISSGWGGLRMTPQFADKFDDNDARRLFYTATQQKDIDDIGEFTNGYAFMKFRNVNADGTPGKEKGFVDTDFPMFRYADVLLMAAEVSLRGSSISAAEGLNYINQVRTTHGKIGELSASDFTLQSVLDERARELYQELSRRSDLVRFNQFTTSDYLWQWKGNVKDGIAVDSYRNLFPIPDSDLLSNSALVQNPGYNN